MNAPAQPTPIPLHHFDFAHALLHGLQMFAVGFVAAVALMPNRTVRDLIFAGVLGGIRAVWAGFHH